MKPGKIILTTTFAILASSFLFWNAVRIRNPEVQQYPQVSNVAWREKLKPASGQSLPNGRATLFFPMDTVRNLFLETKAQVIIDPELRGVAVTGNAGLVSLLQLRRSEREDLLIAAPDRYYPLREELPEDSLAILDSLLRLYPVEIRIGLLPGLQRFELRCQHLRSAAPIKRDRLSLIFNCSGTMDLQLEVAEFTLSGYDMDAKRSDTIHLSGHADVLGLGLGLKRTIDARHLIVRDAYISRLDSSMVFMAPKDLLHVSCSPASRIELYAKPLHKFVSMARDLSREWAGDTELVARY